MSFEENRSELLDPWAWHAGTAGESAGMVDRVDETTADEEPEAAEEPVALVNEERAAGVIEKPEIEPAEPDLATVAAATEIAATTPQLDTARLPSRFQADLMRAIFDATRDECVSVVDQTRSDGAIAIESIRQRGTDEATVVGQRAEEDYEAAGEWLRLETTRLNEEHERRVAQRRDALAMELEAQEAQVVRQVEATQGRLADFEERMKAFVSELAQAPDPAALVALAQQMPVPPTPDDLNARVEPLTPVAGAVVIPGEPDMETAAPEHTWTVLDAYVGPQMLPGDDEALFLAMGELGTHGERVERTGPGELPYERHAVGEVEPHPLSGQSLGEWSGIISALLGPQAKPDDAETMFGPIAAPAAEASDEASEDVVWPVPDGRGGEAESWPRADVGVDLTGEAIDETAGEAAPQTDGAGVELPGEAEPPGAVEVPVSADPWAGATWSESPDLPAVEFETEPDHTASHVLEPDDATSPAGSSAQVAPRSGASALSDIEPAVLTRVSVSGLASVAGVTSFRRQLSRLEGVQGVAVNARSDGSFEFDVTHHPNMRLDDGVTALPGFDARVMASEGDALTVLANDPLHYP